jgi:hypothetical protein
MPVLLLPKKILCSYQNKLVQLLVLTKAVSIGAVGRLQTIFSSKATQDSRHFTLSLAK